MIRECAPNTPVYGTAAACASQRSPTPRRWKHLGTFRDSKGSSPPSSRATRSPSRKQPFICTLPRRKIHNSNLLNRPWPATIGGRRSGDFVVLWRFLREGRRGRARIPEYQTQRLTGAGAQRPGVARRHWNARFDEIGRNRRSDQRCRQGD